MRSPNRIVDDSGHNLDEVVINILNDLAHEPYDSNHSHADRADESADDVDPFFDLAVDL